MCTCRLFKNYTDKNTKTGKQIFQGDTKLLLEFYRQKENSYSKTALMDHLTLLRSNVCFESSLGEKIVSGIKYILPINFHLIKKTFTLIVETQWKKTHEDSS